MQEMKNIYNIFYRQGNRNTDGRRKGNKEKHREVGRIGQSRKARISHALTLRRLMSYIYMEHPFLMFLDHTQRHSTVGRTPLDE